MALLSSSSRVSNSYEVEGILKSGSEERVASNVVELVGGGGVSRICLGHCWRRRTETGVVLDLSEWLCTKSSPCLDIEFGRIAFNFSLHGQIRSRLTR